ncbi:type II toxin-antitoxin system RelE/ParE family toxin [Rhizobium sp. 0TCS1.26]|uniref:type II toxin-antitoxin system RelE/ParE family toxin n=1 Tax=Rhizobium sp. 0TCS1.26 TaxID=3142623 RepID=UPI003D27F526
MRVRFSDEAQRQVLKEKQYLEAHSRWASLDFSAKIKRASRLLASHPEAGAVVGPVEQVRRYVLAPYHIHYVVRRTGIVIISVWHGRQLRQELESDLDPGD